MEETELKELARQLGKPDGEKGLETAEFMNDTNTRMITDTVDGLKLSAQHRVLELGYGNGDHLGYILDQAPDLNYVGLDISSTMHEEAKRRNVASSDVASFDLYDGQNIPADDHSFDRIFTVNTIYFWQEPLALLNEIYRVLTPSGIAKITFAQEKSMKEFPFTKYGFEIYNQQMVVDLVSQSGFETVQVADLTDTVTRPNGETFERHYSIATVTRS